MEKDVRPGNHWENSQYRHLLFCKGFLITDKRPIDIQAYPFCGNWNSTSVGRYTLYCHQETPLFTCKNGQETLFLIGHAYNPFDMTHDENLILKKMTALTPPDFWEYESQLTGIYVMGKITEDGELVHWSDCAGMRISYYGQIGENYYVTSHVNLVASLCELTEDPYVKKLKNSRYFHLFGNILPGDLSVYKELKRTVPNHWYRSDGARKRFYPMEPIMPCVDEKDYEAVVHESARILKNTLSLCAEKWQGKKIAISLTGGKDSGETFASANGNYDRFSYFSYISKPEEAVDANVAHDMCNQLGLEHRIIQIPDDNSTFADFDSLDYIIYINGGSIGHIKPNEIRKRAVLIGDDSIEIEIKSWVNEIVRAYWYKKYAKKTFPKKPNGKYLATLYKVFLENRILFNKTARVFRQYISEYMTEADIATMGDWTTLWSWEFGFSAGEGQSLFAEHMLSFDITIPFNNRRFIRLMLKPKLEDRISDRLQKDVILLNNPKQAAMNIHVVNAAHTDKRARMEKAYLWINSHLPF